MQELVTLIMEADETLRMHLQALVRRQGGKALLASSPTELLRALPHHRVVLVILGSSHHGTEAGIEVARQLHQRHSTLAMILLAHHSSEALAIAALKAGINDYFTPPFDLKALQASMARWLTSDDAPQPVRSETPPRSVGGYTAQEMIGDSPVMRTMQAYLSKVAATDSNVLITGETGTGKELVAQLMHQHSARRAKPLVCINCAAIPDSLLESELFGYERGAFTGAYTLKEGQLTLADGGTIFFDEIGDMSLYAQAKILRALDSREIMRLGGKKRLPLNLRIIAATNRNLHHLMQHEQFRMDLYFRLNVAQIHLPPLRERQDDIPALLAYYLRHLAQPAGQRIAGFTSDAMAVLRDYTWPGNVRELKNLVEVMLLTSPSPWIAVADLPASFRQDVPIDNPCPQDERERVLWALHATNWRRSMAAEKLCWSRMTLYRKMVKYHIVRTSNAHSGHPPAPGAHVTDPV